MTLEGNNKNHQTEAYIFWKTRHHAAGGKTRLLDQWEHQGAEVWGLLHTAYWARTVCTASTGARFPVVTVADKLFTLVAHGGS